MTSLQGQIALVTGATRGIGKACALELGRMGATVLGTATSAQGAEEISAYLGGHQVAGGGLKLNVNDADEIAAALENTLRNFGNPAILVNNAGITRDNLLMRMKEQEWDDILDTNLKSVYRMSQALLKPMMKARYGRIISVASVVGVMGNAGQSNYAAAKAGIIGFSKSLAREVGSRNITVNCVAPGFIDTDMTRALSDAHRQALLDHIPLGRLGSVEDIAAAVGFLASPKAAYITGATLHINGGMYME